MLLCERGDRSLAGRRNEEPRSWRRWYMGTFDSAEEAARAYDFTVISVGADRRLLNFSSTRDLAEAERLAPDGIRIVSMQEERESRRAERLIRAEQRTDEGEAGGSRARRRECGVLRAAGGEEGGGGPVDSADEGEAGGCGAFHHRRRLVVGRLRLRHHRRRVRRLGRLTLIDPKNIRNGSIY